MNYHAKSGASILKTDWVMADFLNGTVAPMSESVTTPGIELLSQLKIV